MRNHVTSRKRLGAALGVSVAAVMVVGGAAVSIAADESDGRGPGVRPGAPVDSAPAPAPAETGDEGGRDADAPPAQARTESTSARVEESTAASEAPANNGRGGVDPAPPVDAQRAAAPDEVARDVGEHDFDEAPTVARVAEADHVESRAAPEAPIDQDVPGAPTGVAEPSRPSPVDVGADDQDG